jgi:1-acyl-sn-glycerol-3-phosphate acyltransferase
MPLLRGPLGYSLRHIERRILQGLFRFFFIYESRGQERVPVTGPAVVASNHPSYLDAVLLSIAVRRPIRFMAWEQLFKVPIVGWLIRSFGAFPVGSAKGQGREAYEKARSLVRAGKVVGIFPEGSRSENGRLHAELRSGAARLVRETGVPLIPATIRGAYRAWPRFRSLPRPARIRVRFHRPIDPAAYAALSDEEAVDAILAEWRHRVERSLNPGAKADERLSRIYCRRAPRPRLYELALAVVVSALLFAKSHSWLYQVAPAAYLGFLLADWLWIPQRRLVKWLRNTSPLVFILSFGPAVLEAMGLPAVPAEDALAGALIGALVPYFYERSTIALGWMRGLTAAFLFELGALHFAPTGLGPHVALPFYAAAYAAWEKTVLWRFAVPLLGLYALGASWYMGGRSELLPHGVAALAAWALTTLFPYRGHDARARVVSPLDAPSVPVG